MSWIMPFPEKAITGEYGTMSEFRRKRGMQPHSGTDWSPAGSNKGKTPIPAVARGTIKLVQFSRILGWVVVQTAMDKDRKVWYIGYCHVKCDTHGVNCKGGHDGSQAVKLKVGDKVTAGDTIAIMGNTGVASSGVHLHATASLRLKGVFGVTADKADLKKLIKANQGVAPKPATKPTSVAPRVTVATPPPVKEAPKPAPVAPPRKVFYKVQSGDTLWKIARDNDTTVDSLVQLNGLKDANNINVGQMIRLVK
jgi:murein DD-endopeptidase MepM/ murein hydrolase activator NlpD